MERTKERGGGVRERERMKERERETEGGLVEGESSLRKRSKKMETDKAFMAGERRGG